MYEGLLELHPQLERAGGSWQLSYGGGAGSDRKTTGSYYTPDQLVQLLIVSALLPVIADRLSKASTPEEKEQALLAIRVLDPACGSGHFLLAAARRLALELARIRAGDEEPSEELRQECLREVVAHCIYGVDKNPMAVELCKVALWIEAVDPGMPLSFLDAHIQCGDSLVGVFDPKVLAQGIPDEAYKPLTGDDKTICTSLKKENASFRKAGQKGTLQGTLNLQTSPPINRSQQRLQEIEAMPETTLAEGSAKQAAYEAWEQERSSDPQSLAADLYTAAFFLPKIKDSRAKVPTTQHLLLVQIGQEIASDLELAVEQAAKDFRFFHWHLRFGEVMKKGGFDCVMGNPPWERIKLQEKEFFAARSEAISTAPNKAARERLIKALSAAEASESEQVLVRKFALAKREAEGSAEFIRGAGRFVLTATGDLNTYALFAETFLILIDANGSAGIIVPTGIATDNGTRAFFDEISSSGKLASLTSFENERFIFKEVHHSFKFCLLSLRGSGSLQIPAIFAFYHRSIDQLNENDRFFALTGGNIVGLNPNTRTCPVFRSQADANLTKKIYGNVPVLEAESKASGGSPWGARFHTRLFHMAEDSYLFKDNPGDGLAPLYEAKLMHLYDHRWATYHENGSAEEITDDAKANLELTVRTRYWVPVAELQDRLKAQSWNRGWLLGWRDITNSSTLRTLIPGVLPRTAVGDQFLLLFPGDNQVHLAPALLGCLSSLACDYCARQKVGGNNLKLFTIKQIPVVPPSAFEHNELGFIFPRVLELTYTANDLRPWAEDLGYDGPPFIFDPERRALLRAELDAFYAHLYGLTRDELRYILDPADVMGPDYPSETFRVLKTNELRQFGEYRTQRLVLEAWDRLFGA